MDEKKRSCNFTSAEKTFLFTLISQKYWQILEDKKTDRASLHKREDAWIQIERDFNAVSPGNIFRNAESLKKLYSNKKKELRKKVAEEKKQVLLTGGGLPPPPPNKLQKRDDDEIDNILLTIMNEKTVNGLTNLYDSDSGVIQIEDEGISNNFMEFNFEQECQENHQVGVSSIEAIAGPSTSQVELGIASCSSSRFANWKSYTPNDLQSPKNPVLERNDLNGDEKLKEKLEIKSKATPTPTTSRRRPTTTIKTLTSSAVAQKYDLLLDKRLVLVQTQQDHMEQAHSLNLKKRKLEIDILEVELKIKKKQLELL